MVERVAFKGRMPVDAAQLSLGDYTKLVKARMRRSIKRNALEYKKLQAKVAEHRAAKSDKPLKTQVREAVILPSWVGMRFKIHTGKEFQEILITANMLGHRLGEFAYTTKRVQHSAPGIRATRGSKFLAVK